MELKLGKLPARAGAVQMRFGAYFAVDVLPEPPLLIGRPDLVRSWGMLSNDRYGDCVWAGAAHETMMLEAAAGAPVATFTNGNVLSDYSAATGFVADEPSTDNGTSAADAAAYRRKTGIIDLLGHRHKIEAYAALAPGDLRELAVAVDLLGVAGVGVSLPEAAERQFNYLEPWDTTPTMATVGGHYVPCVGRNSAGNFLVVTWGRLQAVTPRWLQTYMDEGIAYLSLERLRASGLSPNHGLNLAKLEDDFHQLTST